MKKHTALALKPASKWAGLYSGARANWRDYSLAFLFAAAFPFLFFYLKLQMKGSGIALLGGPFLAGVLAGVAASFLGNFLSKRGTLLLFAAALLAAWILLPGDRPCSSVLFSCGSVCCIGSVPLIAQF